MDLVEQVGQVVAEGNLAGFSDHGKLLESMITMVMSVVLINGDCSHSRLRMVYRKKFGPLKPLFFPGARPSGKYAAPGYPEFDGGFRRLHWPLLPRAGVGKVAALQSQRLECFPAGAGHRCEGKVFTDWTCGPSAGFFIYPK